MSAKIVTIVGARPQFIKCAPMRRVIEADGTCREVLVHTGQHYDQAMSGVFFDELEISPPEHFLRIGGGTHGAMTGRMLEKIEGVLVQEQPDAVMVYGDTNSTLAGALAASKMHIPVIHVEAGLRSFNKRMPEEQNRILTDHVSSLLLAPTTDAVHNLAREGLVDGVHQVGDVMFDAVRSVQSTLDLPAIRRRYCAGDRPIALCTIHRAENTGDSKRLVRLINYVTKFADTHEVYLPLHPGTAKRIRDIGHSLERINVMEPCRYLELQGLLAVSDLVLTDSGGMQKEAYFHGVECITLRDETEWTETIAAGWNMLWTETTRAPKKPIEVYGDGNAAGEILSLVKDHLGITPLTKAAGFPRLQPVS